MPKSTNLATAILKLLFQGVGIAGIADNTATSPLTNLYLSLHTANPGAGGTQSTSEAAYTGYTRVPVPRTTGGFAVANGVANLVNAANFPASTGAADNETEAFFALGSALSGAGTLFYPGSLNPTIVVKQGVQPQLSTATSFSET